MLMNKKCAMHTIHYFPKSQKERKKWLIVFDWTIDVIILNLNMFFLFINIFLTIFKLL